MTMTGIIAIATSCFLYERYAVAAIKKSLKKAKTRGIINQLMLDFGTNEQTANMFWNVIRHGILHQAMPKRREYAKDLLPYWSLRSGFKQPFKLVKDINGEDCLNVEPWLFTDRVLELWRNNLELIDQNEDFPWVI